ncbi:MAG: hypothetical protein OEZ31_10465 [Nitrospirota bacterium]|nr:hypothetical protein [Nitrospirota bacterium]MDH5769361.1 hypothetical protein [Nitrospirota bacterium]
MLVFEAIVSGLVAGILMGLISHAGFKAGIFKSSLFIIDGTFVQKMLRLKQEANKALLLGIPVHLFTSMSFSIGYVVPASLFKLALLNGWLITFYVFILWLSMLFVALPTAGQGFLGRKLGSHTWLEQLALHVIFGLGFWGTLYVLQQ